MLNSMILKYSIKLVGENISVTAPKTNKNMTEINWIKEHKPEIVAELTKRAAENAAYQTARENAFNELRKTNPEMRRYDRLTEKAISRVVDDNWSIEGAVSEYRSIYAGIMDSRF